MLDFINDLLQNKYFLAGAYIIICYILLKIIDTVFMQISKRKDKSIKVSFIKGLFKAIVTIFFFIRVAALSTVLSSFANTILMSSSLLVVVLGFIFQEGLSNIIHGFILSIFKPFNIGDRVEVILNGEKHTGYVRSMTLRHTVIYGIADNAPSIIPNALLDKANIKNLTTANQLNRYPLTISITYKDAQVKEKLLAAKRALSDAVLNNPRTVNKLAQGQEELFIKVDLGESSVDLTIFVDADTAEENYKANSEIKEALLEEYKKIGVDFAFKHIHLVGDIKCLPEN